MKRESPDAVSHVPGLKPVGYVAPYQRGLMRWRGLEDWCEDPVEDGQTITTLEVWSDTLSLPLTMATYTARLLIVGIRGVGLVLVGEDPDKTIVFVREWVPYTLAGPSPVKVDYRSVKVVEGCGERTVVKSLKDA